MERISEFREVLAGPIANVSVQLIVQAICRQPEEFAKMYRLTFDSERTVSWRAIWVCEKLSELHPEWFAPLQTELTQRLLACTHDGSKRLLLSILYNLPVTEPISVPLLNFCLDRMLSLQESIAVQALCIKYAYQLCLKEPELLHELRMLLENAETEYFSRGVVATIRNTLKQINKR